MFFIGQAKSDSSYLEAKEKHKKDRKETDKDMGNWKC